MEDEIIRTTEEVIEDNGDDIVVVTGLNPVSVWSRAGVFVGGAVAGIALYKLGKYIVAKIKDKRAKEDEVEIVTDISEEDDE